MNKDKLGIALSIGCLAHCILTPIILPILPIFFGFVGNLHGYAIHLWMAIIVSSIAIVATFGKLISGEHKKFFPAVLAIIGSCILIVGGIIENEDNLFILLPITISGSICIILAHHLNHKYSCYCNHHE